MAPASSLICSLAVQLSMGLFVGVPLRVAEQQSELPPQVTAGAWTLNDVVAEVLAESTPPNPSR